MLYLTYGVLGGVGTGIVYVGVIGLVVRWFPDRRGFAAGIAAAGYGMGAIVTTFPIVASLQSRGVESTLWTYGIVFAVVGFLAAQGLRMPSDATDAATAGGNAALSSRDRSPSQILRTPVFWLMFVMMTMMATSGLMVTSQMASFAADFGISNAVVFGLAALLHQHTGSWIPVFGTAISLDVLTALLALFVLKPLRQRFVGESQTVVLPHAALS